MITTEVSKTAISAAAAGIAGLCFVGYCIYFDRKRRSDPNFKSNLRKKRLLAKEHELAARAAKSAFPDFTDQQAVQRFFLQEVQMGESYLEQGDAVRGVEHLANAVVVCGQPTELLNVLQRTLPDPVFEMLIKKLPELGKNLMRRQPSQQQPQQPTPSSFGGPVISELDVSDVE
ncbi:mitochondrial import receptor subunit TOM20 homolog [Melanaphis sacchari]|uniref:Mitochondrial import receptor subunit TOM20 n=1 Tax=Melanaphis sacchari TaxID=742174 RepID=A0A2H8TT57_9HEMI|nr:mitochondrial import receptor subunit TOM20 homolog [Melanaphis sacchari]